MRIAIIGPAPPLRGGVAAHTAGLARTYQELGHDVKVLSFARLYPRSLFPGRSQTNGTTCIGEALLDSLDPASWWRGRYWLAVANVDLLVLQWWHPLTTPAMLACLSSSADARVVVVCHNAAPHEWFPAGRLLLRSLLRRATGVVCHSRHVARSLAPMMRDRPVRVVAMPHLLAPANTTLRECAALRKRLGIGETDRMVLFPGHLRRYKGIDVLLEAWAAAELPRRAVLVLAGESYLPRGRLDRMIARSGKHRRICRIDRYSSDDGIRELFAAADCVVLPYHRASQSGWAPVVQSAGRPVIVSEAGGLVEQFSGYERAVFVPPGDPWRLAAALARVLRSGSGGPGPPRDSSAATRQAFSDFDRRWLTLAQACAGMAREGNGRLLRPTVNRRKSR